MAFNLEDFVDILDRWGVSEVLLPFILIFAVVYAVLHKVKFLGEKKNVHMIVALVMALVTVIMHVTNRYPAGKDVVDIINIAIPNIMLVAVFMVLLLLVLGLFGIGAENIADVGYSLVTLILLNVWVANAFNEISTFFLIFSIFLIGMNLILGQGQAFFGRFPIIFGVLILIIMHNAVGWERGLPEFLQFLDNSAFQTVAIGLMIFIFLISLVTREKSEKPTKKLFKLFE